MRRNSMTAGLLALSCTLSAAAPQAQAQAPAAAAPCAVEVGSRTGGVIEVVSPILGKSPTPQLVWRPTASGPNVSLFITYPASALTRMDEPSGLLIRFKTPSGANFETFAVSVRAGGGNGRAWRFDGKQISADSSEQAHLSFDQTWPYGRGLLSAVAEGVPLTISVEKDGDPLESESFVLSNIDARDVLLAQARAKFQALNATTCPVAPAAP